MSTEAPPIAPPSETDPAAELAAARTLAAEVRLERDAQQALFAAGILDLETGVALVKQRIAAAPDPAAAPDIAAIVKSIRTAKPALFKPAPARTPSATLAPAPTADPRTDLARAADAARSTGDARSLMSYLRLKRAAAD
jgi:hypothetical protein